MAEVQMIRSGERSVESRARTKNGSSTEFSDMLKGLTKAASKDRQVTDTKQEDRNTPTDKEDSKRLDPDQEGSVQETDTKDSEKNNKEDNKASLKELTGEELAQLAEMLAAFPKEQSALQPDRVQEADMQTMVSEAGIVQENVSGQMIQTEEKEQTPDFIEGALEKALPEASDAETDIQSPAFAFTRQEASLSVAETGQTASDTEALQQMQGEEPSDIHISDEGTVQTAERKTSADIIKAAPEKEAKEEIHAQQETASAAAAQPYKEVSFTAGNGHVEKLTMKTSEQDLVQDLTKTVISKDVLQEDQPALEITLEPAVLGKITLRVVYQEGRAALSLISDSPKTLELLSRKAGEIAQILQENTGQETVVVVPETSYTEQGQEDNGQQRQQGNRQQERPKQEQTESFAQQLRLGLL